MIRVMLALDPGSLRAGLKPNSQRDSESGRFEKNPNAGPLPAEGQEDGQATRRLIDSSRRRNGLDLVKSFKLHDELRGAARGGCGTRNGAFPAESRR